MDPTSVSMLNFVELDDGTYSVSIKDEFRTVAENIVIPSVYNGAMVTSITEKGFMQCTNLKTVFIPGTVKSIGEEAFNSCSALYNVVLSEGIERLETGAFRLCHSLIAINLPNSLIEIGNACFYECYALKEIIIPPNVQKIGPAAFGACRELTNLNIPESVTYIGFRSIDRTNITAVDFEDPTGWEAGEGYEQYNALITPAILSDPKEAAKLLKAELSNGAPFTIIKN